LLKITGGDADRLERPMGFALEVSCSDVLSVRKLRGNLDPSSAHPLRRASIKGQQVAARSSRLTSWTSPSSTAQRSECSSRPKEHVDATGQQWLDGVSPPVARLLQLTRTASTFTWKVRSRGGLPLLAC
jgi:hypothetical protein